MGVTSMKMTETNFSKEWIEPVPKDEILEQSRQGKGLGIRRIRFATDTSSVQPTSPEN